MSCDNNQNEFIQSSLLYNGGNITTSVSSKFLCNINFENLVYSFLYPLRLIICLIFVAIGISLAFFGLKMKKYTAFFIGFVLFFIAGGIATNLTYLKAGANT